MSETKKHFKDLIIISAKFFLKQFQPMFTISLFFIVPLLAADYFLWSNAPLIQHIVLKHSPEVFYLIDNLVILAIFFVFCLFMIALVRLIDRADKGGRLPSALSIYWEAVFYFPVFMAVNVVYFCRVLLWALLLVLPGIYFASLYSYAPMAVLVDGKNWQEAFVFSQKIVKPHFIKYLDHLFFMLILLLIICYPMIYVLDVWIDVAVARGFWWLAQVIDYAEIIFLCCAFMFLTVFVYQYYQELKRRTAV